MRNIRAVHGRAVDAGYEVFVVVETAWYREGAHENGQEQFLDQVHVGRRNTLLLPENDAVDRGQNGNNFIGCFDA